MTMLYTYYSKVKVSVYDLHQVNTRELDYLCSELVHGVSHVAMDDDKRIECRSSYCVVTVADLSSNQWDRLLRTRATHNHSVILYQNS